MSLIWTLAKKEFLLLLRDRLALVLLLVMPLLFILILGLLLGEGFGQKSDDRLRVSIVDEDTGEGLNGEPWSKVVLKDLEETAGIRVEIIPSREEAETLIHEHKRAAILIFRHDFTQRMNHCSFTSEGMNPFHRDGVYLEKVDAELLKDSTQGGAASIIEQVAQVSLLRVILPWMIGQAFERLSDPQFISILGREVNLPSPMSPYKLRLLMGVYSKYERGQISILEMPKILKDVSKEPLSGWQFVGGGLVVVSQGMRISLGEMLHIAAESSTQKKVPPVDPVLGVGLRAAVVESETEVYRTKVGSGVQGALGKQFAKYNLRGKTWADLTKSMADGGKEAAEYKYVNRDGAGFLKRGAYRYQVLVPSYTVMFAFFLAIIVGWVFVAERRQGTLKRLRAAPVTRGHILLGKMLPCYVLSVGQSLFLLVMGRLLFGMHWGPDEWPWWKQCGFVLAVVMTTSLAVMGLAMLVAAVARSEMQVALFGAVAVLVLALIGGCVLPLEMMPEQTQQISLITPHGWALNAYRELLLKTDPKDPPNPAIVGKSCAVLTAFGLTLLAGAWGLLRLD